MSEIGDQILREVLHPSRQACEDEGLTMSLLVKGLKRRLKAKTTKVHRVKGAAGDMPKGYRPITTTGWIEWHSDGEGGQEKKYTEGETLIESTETAWSVQHAAADMAHKLRGDYPAEKHEHSGTVLLELSDRIREARERTGKTEQS